MVRSPEDSGATYLADSSLLDLFERARADVPGWLADQIDAMTEPDLPEFDPDAALSEAGSPERSGRRCQSTGRQHRRGSDRRSPLADAWDTE